MAILEEVKEIITKYIKIDPERITLESRYESSTKSTNP